MKLDKGNFFKLWLPTRESAGRLVFENPTDNTLRQDAEKVVITAYVYDQLSIEKLDLMEISQCRNLINTEKKVWINIDGLRRAEVGQICRQFSIHQLIEEDILSVDQRPKSDIFEDFVYCLLYQLYLDGQFNELRREQISMVLGKNFVLTFQEEATRDAFEEVRKRLQSATSKVRQYGSDFLYYSLVDAVVDDYFTTMDSYGEKLEKGESQLIRTNAQMRMSYILFLRKELLLFRRTIFPARDVISSLNKNENALFNAKTLRYLKDIYDHILQAVEMVENYREGMSNLQDLHMNMANLKMNESMKVMAIVTCLLAPATVIGGIFGMNFSRIPLLHNTYGFLIAVGIMLLIPLWMIIVFKKRGWF
ncbi:magnesium/cobalt transporter CorA [Arachidicoccus terrestris]|uniref:magnesium/cobalt transporter CorA n=1 Tax=Arachidicoccus terrestris TaxID=2875539 RepID=UPI001CC53416|nr:magnesium/cobalt transporter CorA [Arachidicoccus terrestris]UAY56998.1 magnesium/cobalt transporter CorA [Arachidicoccus terrestris]